MTSTTSLPTTVMFSAASMARIVRSRARRTRTVVRNMLLPFWARPAAGRGLVLGGSWMGPPSGGDDQVERLGLHALRVLGRPHEPALGRLGRVVLGPDGRVVLLVLDDRVVGAPLRAGRVARGVALLALALEDRHDDLPALVGALDR